jgi:hypothetical protein
MVGMVQRLAEEVQQGLQSALPRLRKTVVRKLSLAVGAMLEAQTPNTVELANVLPLPTERQDMREQWLRRLLKNPLLVSADVLEPFARAVLGEAAANGQTVLLSLDQTDLSDHFAVLMLAVRVGERSLPLAWHVEAGPANIGFTGQQGLLDRVRTWLPAGAAVMLLADRFYPSADLFAWLHQHGWQYRLRLKGNLIVDTGEGETTTGALALGVTERYLPQVHLFTGGVPTNLGIWQDAGQDDPWIIAMECPPTRAAVRDYGARWAIEPTFSDYKSRGFQLEDTQLQAPDRLDRLILIMTLAMYWCVHVGRHDAQHQPTALEKKAKRKPTQITGRFERPAAVWCPGLNVGCASS